MALTMLATVFAGLSASANAQFGSITIQAPGDLTLEGQDFYVYQVFSVTYRDIVVNGENVRRYAYELNPDFQGYEDNDPNGILGTLTLREYILAQNTDYPYRDTDPGAFGPDIPGSPAMIALSESLNQYVINEGLSEVATATGGVGAKTLQFTDLEIGYYLVLGTGYAGVQAGSPPPDSSTDAQVIYPVHILVTVLDEEDTIVALKADAPTIDKEIWNHHFDDDNVLDGPKDAGEDRIEGDWWRWNDVSIGDEVFFRLSTEVPKMPGYYGDDEDGFGYLFSVHDVMSEGLTFDNTSVRIFVGGTLDQFEDSANTTVIELTAPTHYDLIVGPTDGHTFDIVFKPLEFVKLKERAGDPIYIYYKATLNTSAVIELPGNPNDVYLEYSNNPFVTEDNPEPSTTKTPWSRVIVYTGKMSFIKVDEEDELATLPGAEFLLLRNANDDDDDAIWFQRLPDAGTSANPIYVYRVISNAQRTVIEAATPDSTTQVLVTPQSGEVRILGLGAGYDEYKYDNIEDKWEFEGTPDQYGIYWLKEIKAPDGYYLRKDPIMAQLLICCVYSETYIGSVDGLGEDSVEAVWGLLLALETAEQNGQTIAVEWVVLPEAAFYVPNSASPEFPGTGGIGRNIFIVAGISLMGFALVGLVVTSAVRKKKVAAK